MCALLVPALYSAPASSRANFEERGVTYGTAATYNSCCQAGLLPSLCSQTCMRNPIRLGRKLRFTRSLVGVQAGRGGVLSRRLDTLGGLIEASGLEGVWSAVVKLAADCVGSRFELPGLSSS